MSLEPGNSFAQRILHTASQRGWNTRPLKYLFKRQKVLGAGDELLLSIYRDYGVVAKESRDDNFNKSSDDLSKYQVVHSGDLVVNKMKAWQGSVAVSELDGIISPAYFVYKPSGEIYQKYAHYLLRSGLYFQYYASISTGVRPNQWDLDPMQFDRMPVPTPPPIEQRQIADYLDHETAEIDAFIADLEVMQSLVLERGEAERDKMIWDADQRLIPLRRLISYVDQGSSPQATSTPAGPGEVGILKSGCTNFGQFNPNANKAIPEGMDIPENYFVKEGDLIVSRASGSTKHVASTAVVPALDRSLALSDKHYRLHMNYGVDVHYIATVMQSMPFRNQLEPYISGASGLAKNISLSALKSMTVPALSAADQSHIGNKTRESFLKIRETTQSIATAVDLARERRAAFITAAVTGQIDVTAMNKPAAEQLEDDIAQGLHKES